MNSLMEHDEKMLVILTAALLDAQRIQAEAILRMKSMQRYNEKLIIENHRTTEAVKKEGCSK